MNQPNPFAWVFSDQAVDPHTILGDINPQAVPMAKPPEVANYRKADIQGIACAFCSKFVFTGLSTGGPDPADNETEAPGLPKGVCDQWEANVDGWFVCDRFASGYPAYGADGQEIWSEFSLAADAAPMEYHEIHLSSPSVVEKGGKLVKGILRTGEWDVTPTPVGKIKKPLKIVKDGKSDPRAGVIALQEILDNFKAHRGVKRVQMPFSDKKNDDHIKDGNLARVNSGFVDDLWIEERDGVAELMAACDVRDPKVREGVTNRTLEDVSSGIPFHPEYGAFLEHVCITNTPFIDGLSGWITASDDTPEAIKNAEVVHHVLPESEAKSEETVETEDEPEAEGGTEEEPGQRTSSLSFGQILAGAAQALENDLNLVASHYTVQDATTETVTIAHPSSETTWTVAYTVQEGEIKLAPIAEWTVVEDSAEEPASEEPESDQESDQPEPSSEVVPTGDEAELRRARELREMRVTASAQHTTNHHGGKAMTVITREELERLELSDDVRARLLETLDEHDTLRGQTREQSCTTRIEELKGLGFSDRPGFLKLYRDIYLSDDGGPAAIVFSDDGKTKESLTALQILDNAIEALKGSENKVEFSDQHTQSGNDNPPPNTDGPDAPVEERVKHARDFLFPNGR